MRDCFKKLCVWMLILTMLLSGPLEVFASVNHDDLSESKAKFINNEKIPINPVKLDSGQSATDFIKNPVQPDIYTLHTDFKTQKGEKYDISYQPYIASVGADATQAEKDKVNKTIDMPKLAGYDEPQDNFTIDYDTIVNKAKAGIKSEDKINGDRYSAEQEFKYAAKSNSIKIKHVFQDLEDFTKYTNPNGSVGEEGELITTQQGNTGSTMEVSPLTEGHPNRKGFVPEAESITMQVPENATNFILEYRYNRAHYDVTFDTAGGTALPARTLYYGQVIPKIADADIPTKVGGEFQGWKPSVDLSTKDGKTYNANEIIKVGTGQAIKNLAANLLMPANNLTFTAVWKDKDKAGYAVQFWAEKADHAGEYDYIGTRVYKDQMTGSRPDIDNEPVKDIVFPDLDPDRLAKIWKGDRFNRGKDLYLNKFYVYNQKLTHEQNKDPDNANLVKPVDSTGKTVYNIYYDRQEYELYFTKSNALPKENTFYPEIWGYDGQGKLVKKGGPGNPYHYKARFNQLMLDWPNDAMQTKGFSKDMQSFGWGSNYNSPNWPFHLDTPPYRLNADQFLDLPKNYDKWGGYTKNIDKGDGSRIDLKWYDYKILSFGIKQDVDSMPHHMDFWMDGFKNDETIIRYDLYRYKADTNSDTYAPVYPRVQGFTGKRGNETPEYLDSDGIDAKNDERKDVTPFPAKTNTDIYGERPLGKMPFIKAFFNNGDEWGDPDGWDGFGTNGYLKFEYERNKYPLRFNYDPSKIKGDNEFGKTNSLDTFYEFPLKVLSPDLVDNKTPKADREYFKDNPANLLDNPENLLKLKLTDLVFKDPNDNNKLKVRRPDNLSNQMVFKGWALDPAGTKLIWENPGEIMPNHPVNLYAKWGEPDYKWKVTFDPNGGVLRNIKEENLTRERKKIQEGDIGQEKINTYAKKEANEGDKQVFTVIQRQKLVEPKKPTRNGYDFMGWEVIRYKKNAKGDYTDEIDNSYRETYKVPELYSFGNDVVAPIYLKAIWTPNNRVKVKVEHYFLDKDFNIDTSVSPNPKKNTLADKRAGYLVATTGDKQDDTWTLVQHKELEDHKDTSDVYSIYKEYNDRVKLNNSFFQTFKVEPEKIDDGSGKLIPNPDVENNVFKFFYKKFRTREYKVNYIDERFKNDPANGKIIDQELVSNGNRHFDARNYRPIPGWKLTSAPQQQLFFDVNEDTNEFLGINGTGKDEITFYYKDVRVIEVKDPKDPVPDGYVRVTFKIDDKDKGGVFKDKNGNSVTELHYDVIKGLKSDRLPHPIIWKDGKDSEGKPLVKEENRYYITPDTGKAFKEWKNENWLNEETEINRNYTFTAYFNWEGLSATGLVRTEAFKDPNPIKENPTDPTIKPKDWTNNFAPTIEQLKAQLVWKEKDVEKPLPAGVTIKLYDEAGNDLTTDDQVYALVNEKGKADKEQLVRTVNVKAKVTFKDGKEPQELDIPIKVYKNVYEALTTGEKPLFLSEAEKGDLKDITGEYVKVTVAPTGDMNSKDNKVYYVNKNAWVVIPEVKPDGSSTFINWTADQVGQNDDGKGNGNFDFGKRHKFTTATIIQPVGAGDVVEQTDPNKKPDVPNSYVKVIVKTTDKATSEFTKTFWVNPTKEVTIPVTNPTGKTIEKTQTEPAKAYTFKDWKSEEAPPRTWTSGIKGQFTKDTTITAEYTEVQNIIPYDPVKDPTTRPDGYVRVTFVAEKGLNLDNVKHYYVKKNAGIKLGNTALVKPEVKAETGYEFVKWDQDDATEITDTDIVVTAKAKELDPFIPADGNKKPDGYVTVTFVAEANGSLKGVKQYYVNPTKYVAFNPPEAIGDTGYEFASWSQNSAQNTNYKKDTTITAKFNQIGEVSLVEKPGYVRVDFVIKGKGGSILDGQTKTYYVDPNRKVTLNAPVTSADVGYEFNSWSPDPATKKKYTEPTTIEGTFNKLKDIIPADGNTKPDGYVTLTFEKGNGGKTITGQTIYYVNPAADPAKTLAEITKPNVTPDTGYKITGWDTEDNFQIKADKTVTAKYKELDPVIVPGPGVTKPEGYATVTFDTTDKGVIEGTTNKEKIVYVNPKKPVILKDYEPKVTPTTNNVFARWDVNLEKETFFKDGDRITAQYYDKNNISVTEVTGYVKVVFDKGDHGNLSGTQTYWVRPGVDVTVPAPTVNPSTGYEFNNWNNSLTVNLPANSPTYTIKAEYKALEDIIEGDKIKPNGYVKVEFVSDGNGDIIGTRSYYVNPTKPVDLTSKAEAIFKNPNLGYTEMGGNWSNDKNKNLNDTFSEDTTFKYNFKELPSVDTTNHPGYVKVEFIAGENGQIVGGNKTYYVNPNKNITVGSNDLAIPETSANTNYVFEKWFTDIDKTNPVTSDRTYIAQFKLSKVTLTYEANDATKGTVPAALSYDIGTEVTLAGGNDLKKDNYVLKGWNIDGTEYAPGAKFTINGNTKAIAVWETDYHNVDFNTDGGTYIGPKKIKHNETIGAVTNPEKVNYTFTGWQVDGQDFDPTTSKVTKDITLVAQYVSNIVEQTEPNTKPKVPDDFVKVIVKTTEEGIEKATDATKFEKTFWVKKNTQVTIPVNPPTGDVVKDENGNPVTDASGKEVKWVFTGWTSPLTDSFSQDETIITAKYESKVPEPKIDAKVVETYAGRQPEPSDYENAIKMQLGQDEITFKNNVSKFEITKKPDVSTPGMSEAEVTIEFKNGTKKTIKVPVKVNPNIYPADTDGRRTSETPANYVRVIVNPTVLNADPQIRIYYVNPEVEIGIPLPAINPQNGAKFIAWHIEEGTRPEYNGEPYKFTQTETIIVADFDRAPGTGLIMTDVGVYPRPEDYKDRITVPQGKTIQDIKVIKKPNVDKPGITDATVEITYDDGKKDVVGFTVFVQAKYEPQPEPQPPIWSGGGVRYETIYKEKIVEVPTKINFFKEVRYMQGFQGYFRPKDGLRRCEAAQILANALKEDGYKYDLSYKINYKDIGNEWYTEAVKITTQANVFMGYSDGYFRPYDKITRAEWIATLRRFQNIDKVNGNHMNLRNDHWALAEIEGAYKEGWLKIYTDGLANFKADEFIPRQEVAAVSNRAFNRVCDRVYISRNDKNLTNYKDINPSMWAYQDILCASNTFIHDKKNYRAHGIKDDKVTFNVNIDGLEILQSKFQRTLR
ncbi:hypothetical protein J2S72_000556 [Peptoniphilus koenoeneniae]|uniref:SLH domain-containing protein n=1 Tax=Peptoniphilus koenoeneniae TaxID=507751 RepID=A0ABU0AVR2_9FIRM|nr:InlB B-repeat-containing protein [Peptoniphilus koenoeneniae]MDQ0274548.1 hypothetical protein [Peptoniphilus koenoeneniae]